MKSRTLAAVGCTHTPLRAEDLEVAEEARPRSSIRRNAHYCKGSWSRARANRAEGNESARVWPRFGHMRTATELLLLLGFGAAERLVGGQLELGAFRLGERANALVQTYLGDRTHLERERHRSRRQPDGTPFGNATYELRHLVGDRYSFTVSSDW